MLELYIHVLLYILVTTFTNYSTHHHLGSRHADMRRSTMHFASHGPTVIAIHAAASIVYLHYAQ
jgi:hypothetical protein